MAISTSGPFGGHPRYLELVPPSHFPGGSSSIMAIPSKPPQLSQPNNKRCPGPLADEPYNAAQFQFVPVVIDTSQGHGHISESPG